MLPPMKKTRFLLSFLLLMGCVFAEGQDFSNKGTDFWLAYPSHVDGTASVMGLYITSSKNTTGTVQLAGGTPIAFTVQANVVTRVFLNSAGTGTVTGTTPLYFGLNSNVYLDMHDGIKTNAAIKVTAQDPIVVYSHIIRSARSAATLALPTQVLGNEYIAPSMNSISTQGVGQGTNGTLGGAGEIVVVATQDNTTIEITPTSAGRGAAGNGVGGKPAGTPFQVTLAKAGDCYQFQSVNLGDLSGTKISSKTVGNSGCKPIAVFSATTWSAFDCAGASGGDNLYQQLFPTRSWGKIFVTAPFINRPSDIFRIYVQNSTTTVQIQENGVTSTLGAAQYNSLGKFYTYKTNNAILITASEPISVAQYITSQTCKTGCFVGSTTPTCWADPEMVLLNPVEQTLNDITFFSAHSSYVPSGQTQIQLHFVNVIISKNFKTTVKIDNATPKGTFVDIPGSNYTYLQEDLSISSATNPIHRVTADTSFSAIVYGYGNVESYGYNGGTNVKDFTPVATFQNAYSRIDSAVTCAGSPVQFSVPLSFVPNTLKWDFSAAPNISPNVTVGPTSNPVPDSTTLINGQTLNYFSTKSSYTFTRSNTSALRDTIKLYSTSSTPDGCGSTDQVYTFPVIVNEPPVANFTVAQSGCLSDSAILTDQSSRVNNTLVRWLWNFSDGTTADVTTANITPKLYTTAGTGSYDIKLKVVSDIGCVSNEVTQTVKLSSKPSASFTAPPITCVNSNITFTDASTIQVGTIAKWTWDLDNGAGSVINTTNAAQTTSFTSFGPKDVKLVVESSTGCKSDTFRISPQFKVNALPEPGFIIPEVCLNDASAQFTDTTKIADGSAAFTYLWNFNAATPPFAPAPTAAAGATTSKNPLVKYNDKGNYKVSLTVTSNGCVASLSKDFTVNGANPIPLFEVQQPTALCSNDSVRIKNKSTVDFGNVTRLEIFWDANDLTKKTTDENPSIDKIYAYRYPDFQSPAAKNYTITLRAYSGNAASCSKSVTQVVSVNASPKVSFVTIPGICNEANARQITQTGFDPLVPGTFAYTGTAVSTTGLFTPQTAGVGSYPIKYMVTSAKGCKDSATKNITVWPSPVAKWTVSTPTCQNNDLVFTDSSVANFSNITQRIWNYDDGTTAVTRTTAASYTRKFATAKNYNISLQVFTDSGCKSTVNLQPIKVNALPKPAFTLPGICLPDGKGEFKNQSTIDDGSEALFSYLWNFNDPNDPSASTLAEPVHKYSALGPYNVQLKITSKDGCIDSLTKSLTTIYPQPKADFGISAAEGCVGDTIRFTDMGNGRTSNAVSWVWDLAGGNGSSMQNPVKKFSDSGIFNIKYYFFNGQGCVSDTMVKQVIINPYPILVLGGVVKVLEGGVVTIKPKFVYGKNLQYLWVPSLYLNSDTAATPRCTPIDDITYRLNLTGQGGCMVSDTIFIQVLRSPEVPNAFSPNGDGINDTWRIKYLESYPGAEIDVFNRYGQIVFHSVGYDTDWDGTTKSKPLPVGTYYYVINPKNNRPIITGSVTIIK